MAYVRQSDRGFGLTMSGALVVVTVIVWMIFGHALVWAVILAAIFFVIALLKPALLLPANRLWFRFAQKLSGLTNLVVLGLFFFSVVLPFGLVCRMLGKDPLRRRPWNANSYWIPVNRQANPDTFSDMF